MAINNYYKSKARSKLWQPLWDDLKFPATGQGIDTTTGRISYNYTDLGVTFANNARYTEEVIGHIIQMPHAWQEGSTIHPHIHWLQSQAEVPNFMIEYRLYNNGETPPAVWTKVKYDNTVFPYTSGTILQITGLPEINMSDIRISGFVDIKLYRDTANASSLFSGSDPVGTNVTIKELDIHYLSDTNGSRHEYIK